MLRYPNVIRDLLSYKCLLLQIPDSLLLNSQLANHLSSSLSISVFRLEIQAILVLTGF